MKAVKETALEIYNLVGGKGNILSVDSCFTRLRLELKNIDKVNVTALKRLGAKEVIFTNEDYVQIVLGPKVIEIAEEFKNLV